MTTIERLEEIKAECIRARKCIDCKYYSKEKYVNFGCPWKTGLSSSPAYWKPELIEGVLKEY